MECVQRLPDPDLPFPRIEMSRLRSNTVKVPALVTVDATLAQADAGTQLSGHYEDSAQGIRVPVEIRAKPGEPRVISVSARIVDPGRFSLRLAVILAGCACFLAGPQLAMDRLEIHAVGEPLLPGPLCGPDDYMTGRWNGQTRWVPEACEPPLLDERGVRRCVRDTTVLMIGDSAMEEKASLLLALAGYWTAERVLGRWQTAAHCKDCYRGRSMDTAGDLEDGSRVIHVWAGHTDECNNWGGIKTLESDRLRRQVEAYTAARAPGSRMVVVFNSGLHDLYNPEFEIAKYEAALATGLDWLASRLDPGLGDLLVLKTTSTHLGVFECSPGSAARYGELGVRLINDAIRREARQRGLLLWDEYAMLSALDHGAVGGDGHHCMSRFKQVIPVCPGVFYNSSIEPHTACREVTAALVGMVCAPE